MLGALVVSVAFLVFILPVDASETNGTIDATDKYAKFIDGHGKVNFKPANGTAVSVTDSALAGDVWGEKVGWINLQPTNGGVTNDAEGNLSGYAWGENTGWINFNTTNAQVTIDDNGYFEGYAWSENYGWLSFNCSDEGECGSDDYKVRTDWRPESVRDDSDPECSDGIDNDGDGDIDHPDDEGCSSSSDDSEDSDDGGDPGTSNSSPEITLLGNDPTVVEEGEDYIEPGYTATDSEDGDLTDDVTVSGSVDTSTVGEYTLTYEVYDSGNRRALVRRDVHVVEPNERPIITLVGDEAMSIEQGSLFTDPGATASDPEDGDITGDIDVTGSVNTSVTDTYILYYDVTDSDGKSAVTIVREVTVTPEDQVGEVPTISLIGPAIIELNVNDAFADPGATAMDPEDGDLTDQIVTIGSVDTSVPGTYFLRYDVTDSDGNAAPARVRQIRVTEEDDEPDDDPDNDPDGDPDDPDDPDEPRDDPDDDSGSGGPDDPATDDETDDDDDVITTTVREVAEFYNSPVGSVTTKVVSTAGLITGSIGAAATLFMSPLALGELFLIPLRLWALLLSLLGLKKRYRPWGTVYDSVTKQPLDPAYVILEDMDGNELKTSITDLDGRFGFLIGPGRYRIKAHKTNYSFPSEKLAGQTDDDLHPNLYFGEPIDVTEEGGVVAKNIPMDPEKFDWNEFAKNDQNLMKFYSRFDVIKSKIVKWLFYLGFVVTLVALFFAPEPYNYIIFALYVVVVIVSFVGLKRKKSGRVVDDETGAPLSFAIVRLFSPNLGREISKTVCDKYGRYFMLISNGDYYVVIERKTGEDEYEKIFTSESFKVKNGIVKKKFRV
ncbi:MAG: immunoglobulin-like domain-containing protein [Candidatus Paceibacterota bacterium]